MINSRRSSSRARHALAVCGGTALLTIAALASIAATPACAERVCLGSEDSFGNKGQGELVGPGIWETTPQYGKWLPFPAQRRWYLFPQQLAGTDFARILVYISAAEEPNPTEQYTLASGDSALIRQFPDGRNHGVEVKNNTCADFFVRVVIEGYPPGAADAGLADADADASASDAPSDSGDAGTAAILTDGATE